MLKERMIFTPRFAITESILNDLTTIATSVAAIDHAPLIPKWEVSLRRDALIRNAHSSTAIEGNPLSLEQVSDLAAGRDVTVQRKAKLEVLNYLKALEKIPELAGENFSESLVLKIHKILTREVLDNPQHSGAYRKTQVVVGNRLTGEVSFRPPPAEALPALMKAFLAWLDDATQKRNPVLEGLYAGEKLKLNLPACNSRHSLCNFACWYLALSSITNTLRPALVLTFFNCFKNIQNVSALNISFSLRRTNLPSRNRTAPKYPTLFRVGSWNTIGSFTSGGIHIRHREPSC